LKKRTWPGLPAVESKFVVLMSEFYPPRPYFFFPVAAAGFAPAPMRNWTTSG
jgi:hypothetical protein